MTRRTAFLACGALLGLYGWLAFSAVLTKAPTFDEPMQAMAGWLRLHHGDHRMNFDNPPLTLEWGALANGPNALRVDLRSPEWARLLASPPEQWAIASHALFGTPDIDGGAFVNRARAMMLLPALLLGLLIAVWTARLSGPAGAVIATILFALDPGFLAHGPLVKNDVATALALLAIGFLAWRIGQRLTWWNGIGLGLVLGLAVNVKFSCVAFVPIAALLLLTRALLPTPWIAVGREVRTRSGRLLVVLALGAGTLVAMWAVTWAAYGFRYAPTPEEGVHLNIRWVLQHLRMDQLALRRGGLSQVRPEDVAQWRPDVVARAIQVGLAHRLLPEAWLDGFLYIYSQSQLRPAFLLGSVRDVGWWYYFPFTLLVKTPLAMLLAVLAAAMAGVALLRRGPRSDETWWRLVCLVVPPLLYFASSMSSHMNIGVRHLLPVYAFAFVACGVVADAALRRWRRASRLVALVLAAGLAAETLAASPDFIPFFNLAAGGARNGVHLLGDSNLDWGQDLTLVARWQEEHPEANLYLAYFGTADPAFYGVRAEPLFGTYTFGAPPGDRPIRAPAVLAVSATYLQGLPIWHPVSDRFARLRERTPRTILGGSIYLFDVPDEATATALGALEPRVQ